MSSCKRVSSTLFAVMLLAACGRTSSPEAAAGTDESATEGDPAPHAERDYYAKLVKAHGEDLSACPPAETAHADACPADDTPEAAAPRRVLLMLDASGSMAARQGGRTKLAAAQDALIHFMRRLEGDAQVALRVYGHRGSNREADKAVSCEGTELLLPFAPRDVPTFEAAVRSFQPRGFTPIAASLQAAAQDFARGGANASGNLVYLVSDGIETCDGDPAAAARALNASNIKVIVNVIGFDVDAQAERQLRDVAQAGGGEYIVVRSGADLEAAFSARVAALTARYSCRLGAGSAAFNRTAASQSAHYNCVLGKASKEFNAVLGATWADARAGRISDAQRAYSVAQATVKYDRNVKSAGGAREAAVGAASRTLEAGAADAAREHSDAQQAADAERERN